MSDDIVDRLRRYRAIEAHRAADQIERLRKAEEHILKVLELANKNCHERNLQINCLREALQGLLDVQNGAPLIRDQREYEAAVETARTALAKAEGRS
jgi:hypothetical protein